MKRRKRVSGNPIHFKKMPPKQQARFIQTIGELLSNGFSLQQALDLVDLLQLVPQVYIHFAKKNLQAGESFHSVLQQLGFKQEQLVQVELAEIHGNLVETLKGIAEQFRLVETFRKELKKVISYPLLLLIFLLGIFVSLRELVLPQLLQTEMVSTTHWGIYLLQSSHWLFLGVFGSCFLCGSAIFFRLKNWEAIKRSEWISKQWAIGRLYRSYQSAYLALEIGKLFYEGLDLKQIIRCLKETKEGSLVQSLAYQLMQGLEVGIPLAQQFEQYSFLTTEFSRIVLQGEAKGNLGKELLFYSEITRKEFFQKIHRWLHWIQPVLFLGIAALILLIYAAILLPVYGNIEEVLL
ncbi:MULTISPECIES: competence type IV pilus assembly protein ComGB [unclassified Enterococcus]|uniref:competence type IV pilus assembly protein ComGB n=1 Tax=unclassified Enterococcus TaxID=2608891 RepID=UPI001A91B695|nr:MULTISPECIES: competence type IV pilus assembly protein ComGB [unclassified Enterococcus]MBO0462404.1 type II secretion system F family protein [Enterococcus sp. DIV1298c]MBO1300652.1 type II secretion system F family protein [Enterococcus sp. DIV1271a]